MNNPKNEIRRSPYLIFFPLVFFVLILEIVRLPALIAPYRPDFTGLLLIFFAIIDGKRVNVGVAWLTGLVLDLLTGATLGINALVFALEVYLIISQFKHFAAFRTWQQMIIIGLVSFISHVGVYWFGHLIGQPSYSTNFAWQTLVTMFTWPIIKMICGALWFMFNVSSEREKNRNSVGSKE